MLAQERQNIILEMLQESKTVQIAELTKRFSASLATIRRDLSVLEQQGLINRVYGGAVLAASPRTHQFFAARTSNRAEDKANIGIAAASLVQEGETIVLDIGTTTLEVARQIKKFSNLTVLTSSLPILNELANSTLDVYSLGGRLRPGELCFSGDIAANTLRSFYVDKAFIGAGGVTLQEGISDYNYGNAQLRRIIMERAKQTILVTDSSKFDVNAFAIVDKLENVDVIITDKGISQKYREGIRERHIQLIIAGDED